MRAPRLRQEPTSCYTGAGTKAVMLEAGLTLEKKAAELLVLPDLVRSQEFDGIAAAARRPWKQSWWRSQACRGYPPSRLAHTHRQPDQSVELDIDVAAKPARHRRTNETSSRSSMPKRASRKCCGTGSTATQLEGEGVVVIPT